MLLILNGLGNIEVLTRCGAIENTMRFIDAEKDVDAVCVVALEEQTIVSLWLSYTRLRSWPS